MPTRLEHLVSWFDEQLYQEPKVRDERVLRAIWKNIKSEIEQQETSLKGSLSALKIMIAELDNLLSKEG